MPRRTGPRNLVEIPQPIMQQLMSLSKTPGALAQLSRKAGLPDTYLYRTGHGEGTHMNEDYLNRVEQALAGHDSPPTDALLRQSKNNGKRRVKSRSLVKHRKTPAAIPATEVHSLPQIPIPLMNGREAGLRGLFDGLAMGIGIARQTLHEYLDAANPQRPLHSNGHSPKQRG